MKKKIKPECLLCKYYIMWWDTEAPSIDKFVTNSMGMTLGKCKIYKKDCHPQYSCGRFRMV